MVLFLLLADFVLEVEPQLVLQSFDIHSPSHCKLTQSYLLIITSSSLKLPCLRHIEHVPQVLLSLLIVEGTEATVVQRSLFNSIFNEVHVWLLEPHLIHLSIVCILLVIFTILMLLKNLTFLHHELSWLLLRFRVVPRL